MKTFWAIVLLGWSLIVTAEDEFKIIYGVYDSPPWLIKHPGGDEYGISPEYIAHIETASGKLTFDLQYMSFQRAMLALQSGKVEMMAAPYIEAFNEFATPIISLGKLNLFLYTMKPYHADSLTDLPKMNIGHLRGLALTPFLESKNQLSIHLLNAEYHGFISMHKGFLDGVISAEAAYRYYWTINGYKDTTFHKTLFIDPHPLVRLGT